MAAARYAGSNFPPTSATTPGHIAAACARTLLHFHNDNSKANNMNRSIHPLNVAQLLPRDRHCKLDHTPIHVGDVVHLKPANGPEIRATVIYNAPINGTVTYTTDLVRPCGQSVGPAMRIRFRHEHVHRIEPVRRPESRTA